ncbi:uncharacterized protein JN550_012605 [Neoarthrinium moseri]|uniref:uncharacterized protein n=1 Tax=Neoarthrinium moseri TaxID=1658444 RepID=UPI001FDC468E|nr:uncharacterized protein JN550_012605 [Neoarthrinium moseri]KAI1858472.1 hypothetical protein JN550_012605 [Neoarthrinium moseri]
MKSDVLEALVLIALIIGQAASQAASPADSNLTAIVEYLEASVPKCAFDCFVSTIPKSSCALTDTACICSNAGLAEALGSCMVAAKCTVIEQLQTQRFEKIMCGAEVHDDSNHILATTWALYSTALIFVAARLWGRAPHLSRNAWDDWTIIACLASQMILAQRDGVLTYILQLALTPASAIAHLMVNSGLGRDIWMLDPDDITNTLFYFFIEEYLYTFLVVFTKISILCLYIRIFTVARFRWLCYILVGIVVAFGISCWVSTGFNCIPITFMWQGWDGAHVGTCMDTSKQTFALAGVNMSLDVLIFLLPIPQLLALQMNFRRKLGVILMFAVGLFVTLCSIIRLRTIMEFGKSTNPTYEYSALAIWSLVEIDVGVICASLPGVAGLLQRLWPRVFSTKGSSDRSYPRPASENSGGLNSFRGHRGFSRMNDRKNISKTTSVTISYAEPTMYDTKSDELELVDRQDKAAKSTDLEMALDQDLASQYQPGSETRNYRTQW